MVKLAERYKTTADLPAEIPVFPLVGAILLPDAVLPLNIFEPRYLAMVEDCLVGARIVGMVQPEGEGGATGSPDSRAAALRPVGCAGRLTAFQEMPDGRMLIGLTGIARFTLGEEQSTDKPYRMFRVDYGAFQKDLVRGDGADQVDRPLLLTVLRRFLAARHLRIDWASIEKAGTEELVNSLASASPFGPSEKQALLEAATLADRARVLIALAEMDLASSAPGGGRLQ